MSLNDTNFSQKVLNGEGVMYLLKKIKASHIDKIATDTSSGHVKLGPFNTPTAINGEGIAAPSYHTHTPQTTITGNAGTATKLKNPVNIALTGSVNGNVDFDGSEDVTINTSINTESKLLPSNTILSELSPGDYISDSSGTYPDSPLPISSTYNFTIQVLGSENNTSQIFTDLVADRVYIRTIENGTPSEWKEVLTSSNGNISSAVADKLKTARKINIIGDAEGTTSFDGSKDVNIDVTLSETGVDAGTYGSNSQSKYNSTHELHIPVYTVDSSGRITSSYDQTITVASSGGSSGLNNPVTIGLSGDVSGSKSFDGTTNINISTTLANSGVIAGTYGNTSNVTLDSDTSFKIPKFTVDSKGRITSASTTSVSLPVDSVNKVKSTNVNSGKIYISGKTTSSDSTSTNVHNSNLYYDVSSSTLNVPNISGNFKGTASSADKLTNAVNVGLTGDASGTALFDGSRSVNIPTTLTNTGVIAGTYGLGSDVAVSDDASFNVPQITVDAKGRITSAKHSTVSVPSSALNKVKTTPVKSGFIYITGKTSSDESTGTEVLSPNLYYDAANNTFHAGKIDATIEGVSDTANKLAKAVNINLSGHVTGSQAFDGSKSIDIETHVNVISNEDIDAMMS